MPARVLYSNPVLSSEGIPNTSASVRFYPRGGRFGTASTTYSAETAGTSSTGPFTPDADGLVSRWLPAGRYDVVIDHGGLVQVKEWEAFPGIVEPWTTPTLLNSWAAVAGYSTPGYTITAEGLVLLRGVISGGAAAATAFNLLSTHRPVADFYAMSIQNVSAPAYVIITAGGAVNPALTGPIALDGIYFPVGA